jgi:hypothetical protein
VNAGAQANVFARCDVKRKKQEQQQSDPIESTVTFAREFLKHGPNGEIWAVEWLDDRKLQIAAGRRCSRPEEQTLGALPVLVLDNDIDTLSWLDDHQVEFDPWMPPRTSSEMFDAILRSAEEAEAAKKAWRDAAAEAKELREEWEEAVEALQVLIKQARDGRNTPPALPFDEAASAPVAEATA